jgi:hypothetical protein
MAIDTGLSVPGGRHVSAGTKKKRVAVSSSPAQRATFRDVLAVREFRALWFSQASLPETITVPWWDGRTLCYQYD